MFDIVYTVKNTGNLPAPKGTYTTVDLAALHGNLKELYGMDTDLLAREDISGLAPNTAKTVQTVRVPVSVFKFCGYDAVSACVRDETGEALEVTDQQFLTLNDPMNLRLNDRKPALLEAGEKASVELSYDSTVFIDSQMEHNGGVIYSVEDPSFASVDQTGTVLGLQDGATKLIATLLPSGRKTSVALHVGKGTSASCDRGADCPMTAFTDLKANLLYRYGQFKGADLGAYDDLSRFTDASGVSAWAQRALQWTAGAGIINGVKTTLLSPKGSATRAQVATMLQRFEELTA